jgi:hypothetical protein
MRKKVQDMRKKVQDMRKKVQQYAEESPRYAEESPTICGRKSNSMRRRKVQQYAEESPTVCGEKLGEERRNGVRTSRVKRGLPHSKTHEALKPAILEIWAKYPETERTMTGQH